MERYARGHCRSSGRVEAAEGNSGRQGGVDWGYSARNKLVHPSNAQKSDRLTRVVEACTVAVAAREGVNHVNGWGPPGRPLAIPSRGATLQVRAVYASRVPAKADLVCHWFAKSADALRSGRTKRCGLVGTTSIKVSASRLTDFGTTTRTSP